MIRFFNGRTLTMADGVSVTTDEVWTDGDKIAYVGPAPETLPAFERQIDLGGDLVMPGFKNAHAHAGMSFVRSYADDVPLQPWLFEQIFPLEAKLTPEAVYAFTKLSILEYLTSGITAGFDMYYFREAIAQASIDCGFRTVLCGGGGGLPGRGVHLSAVCVSGRGRGVHGAHCPGAEKRLCPGRPHEGRA